MITSSYLVIIIGLKYSPVQDINKYINKLPDTSKYDIGTQTNVDVQHCRFNIENINNDNITHILLDWKDNGNIDAWGKEYLTFDKDNNTTLTWTKCT